MLSKNLIVAILGIVVFALALLRANSGAVVEGWWGGMTFGRKAIPFVKTPQGDVAVGGNYLNPSTYGSNKFVTVPAFQSVLAPRFSNIDYGANIKYNMPDRKNMAVPCDPLTFGDMASSCASSSEGYAPQAQGRTPAPARENYGCGTDVVLSCGKGGYGIGHAINNDLQQVPPGYSSGNWQGVYDSLPETGQNMGSDLPIGSMTTVNGAGDQEQFLAFNRIMPAPRLYSRNVSNSDFIRGDLAIAPCQSGWFSVYPNISTDLNAGAMKVMNGWGESNNETLALISSAAGGKSTLGGVDIADSLPQYNVNMAVQTMSQLSAGASDVSVTAFP